MKKFEAIRQFFAKDGGRPVNISELKEMKAEDRNELAELAAKELGVELDA